MKALQIKLFRDMWKMSGAVLTISLVVAAGVAAFVTLRGTWLSITETRDRYYESERFGDVFSSLERAPLALAHELAQIDGVIAVEPRIKGDARVPMPSLGEPALAHVVSLPDDGRAALNRVRLVAGRLPAPERDDEALVLEAFAERHQLAPGAVLSVIMKGRAHAVRVVGMAMAPEYVLAVPNGASAPAPERFAVLWMRRPALEAAYDLRSAFNDVVLGLAPDARADAAIVALDARLDRYGGLGAYARARQLSEYFLSQDLSQLQTLATIAPSIFLAVAAFLLNVVLSRLIELDRPQIATLKAVGYSDLEVGLHYLALTLTIALCGAGLGLGVGSWLGRGMTALYTRFYRMPGLHYQLDAGLAESALAVSLAAGLAGAALSVRKVVLLPPAEAMRPAAPPSYGRGLMLGALGRLFGPSARMVLRELVRRPARTLLSALGIGAATGILVIGQFFSDAMGFLIDEYLQTAQRESVAVSFVRPVPEGAVRALGSYPGVRDVQYQATLQVRVQSDHRERIVPLVGHALRSSQRPLLDDLGHERPIAPGDVVLTETLAKVLGVVPGDSVRITPMQGERTSHTLRVTRTLPELMGLFVHLPLDDFHHLLDQAPYVNSALLAIDEDAIEEVQRRLNLLPVVASVVRKSTSIAEFRAQNGETMGTFSAVLTAFAMTIAISVVYNNARVALSMRSRELASLRVLGFTRGEISGILIGELAVQVVCGIPLGLGFGRLLVNAMLAANDPEAFRFPTLISGHTYAFASLVTLCAGLGSALLVRRKLDRLDLIEVLKTRE